MITLFTTCKSYTGIFGIIQTNALRCWQSLGVPVEIIVFGDAQGLEDIKKEVPFVHNLQIECLDGRIPYINAMFHKANEIAKYDILCYLNADILLTSEFCRNVELLHSKLKKNYLIVGQRMDVDIESYLDFGNSKWEEDLQSLVKTKGKLHGPTGSDYFLFPKGQFPNGSVPKLLVGRPGWDLWMIYNGFLQNWKTIDASDYFKICHQNHDYSHKISDATIRHQEDQANYQYLPEKLKYQFQLDCCLFTLDSKGALHKNRCRGNIGKYQYLRNELGMTNIFTKIRNRLLRLVPMLACWAVLFQFVPFSIL